MNGHKCTLVFSTSSSDHQSYFICDDELPDKFKVAYSGCKALKRGGGREKGDKRTGKGGRTIVKSGITHVLPLRKIQ